MKNRIVWIFAAVFLTTVGCSSKNALCECMDKGDELNQFSSELLHSDAVTVEQENKLHSLREEVDQICAPFKEMGPKELYELREECGNFPEP